MQLCTGIKFRVIWPSILILRGGLQHPPSENMFRKMLRRTRASWPLLTPVWPLIPLMHYTSVKAWFFLPNLVAIVHSRKIDPGYDLCVTFRNALHFGQGFFIPSLVAIGVSKATWHLDDLWPWVRSLRKYALKLCRSVPYPHAKFQLDTSKHDETHSRTHILPYIHTYIHTPLFYCYR